MALIYRQDAVCFSAPSQHSTCSPHLDLNTFLRGVSVGESQLQDGGNWPRCEAQASSPCASFSPASLGISRDARKEICHAGAEQCGGTHGLGATDLLSSFHALSGIDPFPKGHRRWMWQGTSFQITERSDFYTL